MAGIVDFNGQKNQFVRWGLLSLRMRMKMKKNNSTLKLRKLNTILDISNCRSLTVFGRCLITKSLGISQLVHSRCSFEYLGAVNSAIFKFYLEKKMKKINEKCYLKIITKPRAPSLDLQTVSWRTKERRVLEGDS